MSSSSTTTSTTRTIPLQHPSSHSPSRQQRRFASPKKRPLIPRTLQGLLLVYLLAAISVFVASYHVTLDDVSRQTLVREDWGRLLHFPQSEWNKTPKKKPNIVLVHTGKTGGTTVGNMLRVLCEGRANQASQQYCLDEWKDRHRVNQTTVLPESQLSQSTHGFLHVTGTYPSASIMAQASHFLLTLRNPMDRVVSWFYYLHPVNCNQDEKGVPIPRSNFSLIDKACITKRRANKPGSLEHQFYHQCFPAVDDFAKALANSNANSNPNCHTLALQTLHGHGGPNGFAGHLWANYTYYATKTHQAYPQTPILAVRTEHLWDDLTHIDQCLGGTGELFAWQPKVEQQQQPPQTYHKDKLSTRGYYSLCCALQDELQVYQHLIQSAINLNQQAATTYLQKVFQKCGPTIQSWKELQQSCRQQE